MFIDFDATRILTHIAAIQLRQELYVWIPRSVSVLMPFWPMTFHSYGVSTRDHPFL